MSLPLQGQAAVVTGASSGIGRATAVRLAELGADVASIQRRKGPGLSIAADLADAVQAEAAVAEAVRRLGRLDICVYAAGVNHREPALDLSLEDWRRVVDLNLTGAFVVTRAAARQFVAQGAGGRIVHVASELAVFGGVGVAPYSASKGGVAQLAKSQSNEWAPLGIQVNTIVPGWIDTDMTAALRADPERDRDISGRIPAGRWGTAEEVAGAIAWMVGPDATYMSGAAVVIDGGYMAR